MLDWVSANVAEAIRYFWEDDAPVVWIEELEDSGGRITLKIGGPGKPDGHGIYTVTVDVLSELSKWSNPYLGATWKLSENQKDDLRARSVVLRQFAQEAVRLSDAAAECADPK
jgi:hypothetical protein